MTCRILLTGPPRAGKTTVIRRVVEQLTDMRLAGFYTRELRRHGRRVGFEAVGLGGQTAPLANAESKSRVRVGKYGVELVKFESVVRAELQRPIGDVDLFVIDEIGKMELFSDVFVQVIRRILDGDVPLLATIALKGSGFISEAKRRPDIEPIHVTYGNRDSLPVDLVTRFRER